MKRGREHRQRRGAGARFHLDCLEGKCTGQIRKLDPVSRLQEFRVAVRAVLAQRMACQVSSPAFVIWRQLAEAPPDGVKSSLRVITLPLCKGLTSYFRRFSGH